MNEQTNEQIINDLNGETYTARQIEAETAEYKLLEAEDNLKDILASIKQGVRK